MSDKWWVALNGESDGPFEGWELERLKLSGKIKPLDMVWREGFPEWVALQEIPNFVLQGQEPIDLNSSLKNLAQPGSARREFLKWFGGAVVVGVTAGITTHVMNETPSIIAYLSDAIDGPPYDAELLKSLFGNITHNTVFIPGSSHHLYRYRYHPDDWYAAQIGHKVCKDVLRNVEFRLDTTPPNQLNGTAICPGEHISNGLSRAALEYQPIDKNEPELGYRRVADPIFQHRWEIITDRNRLIRDRITKVVDRGHGEVPNWSIFDNKTGKYISPFVQKGELQTDYLLITAVPNIFGRESYSSGQKIISFGGTHGVGTRAMDNFLRDHTLMRIVCDKAQGLESWQAIVRVDTIDKSRSRWHPATVSLHDRNEPVSKTEIDQPRLNSHLDDAA